MEESEGLAYDDPCSDSDATILGADGPQRPQLSLHDEPADSPPNTPRGLAPPLTRVANGAQATTGTHSHQCGHSQRPCDQGRVR